MGPVWNDGKNNEREKLESCYKHSLQLAADNHCKTIAFPNISTGIYQFPKGDAAKISIETIASFLSKNGTIEKVVLVCFDDEHFQLLSKMLNK
ncbi:MAG: macro domain-containing protein [Ferruginibacter sp.]